MHGVAWRSFGQYVAANIPAVRQKHEDYYAGLKEAISGACNFDASDGVQERVLEHFAFAAIAGFVAIDADVVGVTTGDVASAMGACFADWLRQYRADTHAPEDEIAEAVRDLVLKHRNRLPPYSAFCDADRDTQIGFTYTAKGIDMVLLLPDALRKINEKYGKKAVKNALVRKGLLILGLEDRPTSQFVVPKYPNVKPSTYALRKDAVFAE